jgi:hypothetical protein
MITHTAECLMTTSLWTERDGGGERRVPAGALDAIASLGLVGRGRRVG